MSIIPISAISSIGSVSGTSGVAATPAASGAGGGGFAAELGKGLDAVSGAQNNADNLAIQAATGQTIDPAQLTIAATQASLMTQLATSVQSKAVAAFNQIMGMQA